MRKVKCDYRGCDREVAEGLEFEIDFYANADGLGRELQFCDEHGTEIYNKIKNGKLKDYSIGGENMNPHDPVSIFKTSGALVDCVDIQQDGDKTVEIMISAGGQKNYATFESKKDFLYWVLDYLFFAEST